MRDSPPKRMTRARAKAQETGKMSSKPIKIATPAAKATRTAVKRKAVIDEVVDATNEQANQPKRPRGRPRKVAEDDKMEDPPAMVEEWAEDTNTIQVEPPRRLRSKPKKIEISKSEPLESNPEPPAPARRTTRAQAAATLQAPLRGSAPARKRVQFQQQDLDKENRLPTRSVAPRSATNAKEAMDEPKRGGLRAKPIRRPTTKSTRGASKTATVTPAVTSSQEDPPNDVEATPLSPKKAQQSASSSEDIELGRPKTPVKPAIKPSFKVQVSTSPKSSAAETEAASSTGADRCGEGTGSTSTTAECTVSVMTSPAKRPPPSPFKNALKDSAKRVKLADTVVFPPASNISAISPPKNGLLALSASKSIVSPLKISSTAVTSPSKDGLLQQPALKLPVSPEKTLRSPSKEGFIMRSSSPYKDGSVTQSSVGASSSTAQLAFRSTSPSKERVPFLWKSPSKAISPVKETKETPLVAAMEQSLAQSDIEKPLSPARLPSMTPRSPPKQTFVPQSPSDATLPPSRLPRLTSTSPFKDKASMSQSPARAFTSPTKPSPAVTVSPTKDGSQSATDVAASPLKPVTEVPKSPSKNDSSASRSTVNSPKTPSEASAAATVSPPKGYSSSKSAAKVTASPLKLSTDIHRSPSQKDIARSNSAVNSPESPRMSLFSPGSPSSVKSLAIMKSAVEGLFSSIEQTPISSPSKEGTSLLRAVMTAASPESETEQTPSMSPSKERPRVMGSAAKSIISPFNLSVNAPSLSSSDDSVVSTSSVSKVFMKPSFFDDAMLSMRQSGSVDFMDIDGEADMLELRNGTVADIEVRAVEPSEASQEYGDENATPVVPPPTIDPALIDPALLAATAAVSDESQVTTPTCTPAKVFYNISTPQEVHTVCKVPLKAAADDSPLPAHDQQSRLKGRAKSLSGPLSFEKDILHSESSKRTATTLENGDEPNNKIVSPSSMKKRRASGIWIFHNDATPTRFTRPVPPTTAPAASTARWSMSSTPSRTPRPGLSPDILKGAVVYVDVYTSEGADASGIFVELLTQMGARCVKQWHWNPNSVVAASSEVAGNKGEAVTANSQKIGITHVVFKDGGKRTLEKVRQAKGVVLCVGVGWVLDCEKENKWVDETRYAVDTSIIPRGGQRRRKSMEPRALAISNQAYLHASGIPAGGDSEDTPLPAPATTSTARAFSPTKAFLNLSSSSPPCTPTAGPHNNEATHEEGETESPYPAIANLDSYSFMSTDDESTSIGTPYFLKPSQIVQKTCPPKPKQAPMQQQPGDDGQPKGSLLLPRRKLIFPVTGKIDDHPDEHVRMRLLAARRKTLQWAPKVRSPLGKAVFTPAGAGTGAT